MSRGPDAATLLERALVADGRTARLAVAISESDWTRWASATFVGARHQITMRLPVGDASRAWLDRLPETDLPLRGHLVADLAVESLNETPDGLVASVEALTVEER